MKIPLFKPYVSPQARKNVLKVLKGTQLAEGEQVKLFEHEFSTRFGLRNVVALNSGTSALALAYELAGISEGDEVITPVLTCNATNIPLLHRKAHIVFADIDGDLNINIQDVKKKITPLTKAIVFVHFGGNNRGLAELLRLCKAHGITLIEDAAQAVGSDFWGKADFTCVSLQAIKTLTSGDGGFLITKRKKDADKARRLRWFGYDREKKKKYGDVDITEPGYKYHMNDITAAIGRGNLAEIDKVLAHRKNLAEIYYVAGLKTYSWLTVGDENFRDISMQKLLRDAGFEVGQHHYRNDKYTIFKKFKNHCPVMDLMENRYFFVPYHHGVSIKDAKRLAFIYQEYFYD